jgi:hypothetical protein
MYRENLPPTKKPLSKLIWILIAVTLAVIVGALLWFFVFNKTSKVNDENWNTYTNEKIGYSVKYPDTWRILNEYSSEDKAEAVQSSVTFVSEDYKATTELGNNENQGAIINVRLENPQNPVPPFNSSDNILSGEINNSNDYLDAKKISFSNLSGVEYRQIKLGIEYLIHQLESEKYIVFISLTNNLDQNNLGSHKDTLELLSKSFRYNY